MEGRGKHYKSLTNPRPRSILPFSRIIDVWIKDKPHFCNASAQPLLRRH